GMGAARRTGVASVAVAGTPRRRLVLGLPAPHGEPDGHPVPHHPRGLGPPEVPAPAVGRGDARRRRPAGATVLPPGRAAALEPGAAEEARRDGDSHNPAGAPPGRGVTA